jgi:hypothetical protein
MSELKVVDMDTNHILGTLLGVSTIFFFWKWLATASQLKECSFYLEIVESDLAKSLDRFKCNSQLELQLKEAIATLEFYTDRNLEESNFVGSSIGAVFESQNDAQFLPIGTRARSTIKKLKGKPNA